MSEFTFRSRLRSISYALAGVRVLLATQANAKIHLVASLCVVGLAAVTGLNGTEWALLIFAMAGVWSAEAMNTGFEFLCNVASPEPHPLVRQAKDVAAAAVLLAAIAAIAVGLIVFLPHLPL